MIASILKTVYTVSDGENSTAEWQGNNFHLTSPGYIPPSSLLHRTVTLAFNQKDEWQRPIRLQTWPYRLTEKSKLSFLWLPGKHQLCCMLPFTIKGNSRPHRSRPHTRKHTSSQKSSSFWLYVGFSSACFQSPRCSYICSTAQAAP